MKIIEKVKVVINSKYLAPIKILLMQGTSHKSIALAIALAFVIGLFPVIGTTTILCTIVALPLRLNLPIMQLINYTIFPIQIITIVPLMKLGEIIFAIEKLSYSASQIVDLFSDDFLNAVNVLWNVILQAIGAWLILAPVVVTCLFLLLHPILVRWNANLKKKKTITK